MKSSFSSFIFLSLFFVSGFFQKANSQTTLSAGDVAIIAFGPSGTDHFAFVILKDIATGTVINFTDNGMNSATTGATGEGYVTYTAPSKQCAGTVITWTNNQTITGTGWNSSVPTGFTLNASGETLFAFQGNGAGGTTITTNFGTQTIGTSNTEWAAQTGITLLSGIQTGVDWITSGSASSSQSYQPSTSLLPSTDVIEFTSKSDVYITSTSLSGTQLSILSAINSSGNYTTSSSSVTFPSYTSFTVNSVSVNSGGICNSGSITLTANGASTYTWSPNTNLSATTGTSVTASPTSTITYAVTGTSALACTASATSVVTVSSNPNVTVNSPTICSGKSATLTANNASSYTWTPNTNLSATTGASITASPTITITYTVTGTNAAGCTASAASVVTVNATPNVTVNMPSAYCNGGSASLTANNASTYTWAPNTNLSATTGASITASPTTTTTYTVTGTAANTCTASATSVVTVNALPNVTVNSPSICKGSSGTLTANNASTYTWTPNTNLSATTGASITASPTSTTTYTVTGTGANSCTASANSIVTVLNAPNVTGAGVTSDMGQLTISWTNPSSCYDEIMVVGKASGAVTSTPGGNGTSYSANQLFGSGSSNNSLNSNEYNVYQSNGSSVVVLGLTNGTTYNFTIFTRFGTSWSSGVQVSGTPNPVSGDYRSKQNGNWSSTSTWQTYNGSTWVNASSYPGSTPASNSVIVQNTITVDGAADPYKIKHLVVNSGNKLYCNTSSTNRYVDIYGNITCNGTIGNDPSYDDISIDIDGTSTIIAGTGTFTATRIRKDNNDNNTTNLTIEMNIKLSWSSVSSTDLYNNYSGNTSFNVTIASGSTVTCTNTGNVAIDGIDGAGSGNRGGIITVNGTLTVPGILYLTTDNSSNPCEVVIGSNGTINAGTVSMASSGSAGHTLIINSGGLLNITGTSGITPFSNNNNTYTLNSGSTIQYSAAGAQTIETGMGDYSYLTCSGSGNKTPNGDITINGNLIVDGAVLNSPNSSTNLTIAGNITLQNGATMSSNCLDNLRIITSGTASQTFNGNGQGIQCYNLTSVKSSGGISLTGGSGQTTCNIKNTFSVNYTGSALFTDNGNLLEIGDDAELGSGTSNFNFTGTMKFTSIASASAHLSDFNASGVCPAHLFNLTIDAASGSNNHKLDIFPTPSGGQNVYIDGSVTIANTNSAGTNLSPDGNILNVKGNWTTYSHVGLQATVNGNATVILNGTSGTQTITAGGDYELFYNLQTNNTGSGITLSDNITVSNVLTLTAGVISTSTKEVDITNTATGAVTGQSSSSYINGNLRRSVVTATTYNFPVGTSSNYELATIKLNSVTGMSNILGFFTGGLPSTMPNSSTCFINSTPITGMLNGGFWTLTPNAFTAVNYDITLNETGYTNFSGSASQLGIIKRHDAASAWLGTNLSGGSSGTQGLHVTPTLTGTVKRTGVQSFSDYGIGSGGTVLPVTLTTFTARPENGVALINWATQAEYNNNYFAVEKSTNAIDFEEIGKVQGNGTSDVQHAYSFTDTKPFTGINYYRLRQVDNDGEIRYSEIRPVEIKNNSSSISIYPVPVNSALQVSGITTSALCGIL